ncbi:LacI family DNA-binding transcriptional regulator [Glycomyces niveus]|jgi:DNA-binding LacI/PurR family transcriptional regulator|uniref:LacI family DNA-binding transcriptional regulator n=1 Tax=Glycomyces niveus TaxID=2820287 RepID=A0ABS3U0L1_9ACTN|nr:LacI family DNA-binding transcriptional regulator [Glycomyces sp. NEAU-S30]MBO3731806.1 LacI family DNA-binding transcriptional regulator [Glycomyces sp. NEAU-S30]
MDSSPDAAADPAPQGEPFTIAQLAEHAGVSVATVSKVVNGRLDVAPETRELVETLIRRHGYRRQKKASRPAPLIEVVFHEIRGLYPVEVINGVSAVARANGLGIVVSELGGSHTPGRGWVEDVLARRPVGVIPVFCGVTPDQRERLRAREIPIVAVDPTGEPDHDDPSVGTSNWNGGLEATRHLLELGHRRIAVITGPEKVLAGRARLDGYRAAMDLAGVPVDPELVRVGDFQIEDGRKFTRDLLRLPDPPTAIFACNDGEALGVYQAAAEAGVRIPEDLSVVGFDDLPMAEWNIPPLTSIRQPLHDMAETAARMLLELAAGRVPPRRRVEIATEFVLRTSTAPPAR